MRNVKNHACNLDMDLNMDMEKVMAGRFLHSFKSVQKSVLKHFSLIKVNI
jgi:hypothetical protein